MPNWLRALAVVALAGALAIVDWNLSGPAATAAGSAAASSSRSAGTSNAATSPRSASPPASAGARPVHGGPAPSSAAASGGASGGAFGRGGSVNLPVSYGATPSESAAADALTTYLTALAHHDPGGISGSSDGGPFAMAGILLETAAIDSARGATTTVTVGPSSFTPTATGPSSVTFSGSVTLTTAISGSAGSGTYTDTISGPLTVADESGGWRVANFTYDSAPVRVWPESVSQTIRGLTATVGYVVSYGNLTAALVTLTQQSGAADVQLQTVKLTAGSTTVLGTGDFTGPPTPSGVLRFPRQDATPSSLAIDFSSSDGQAYDYVLSLS